MIPALAAAGRPGTLPPDFLARFGELDPAGHLDESWPLVWRQPLAGGVHDSLV